MVAAGNFWVKLALSAAFLASFSIVFSGKVILDLLHPRITDLIVGVISAATLYGIFLVGELVLTAILPSADAGIQSVYAPRTALPSRAVGALLLCLTAVAEEVFWRGFVQRVLVKKTSAPLGIAIGLLFYAGVHAWTLNVPLMLAAFVAGGVWSLQFYLHKRLPSVIISHALWSITIFLFLPVV